MRFEFSFHAFGCMLSSVVLFHSITQLITLFAQTLHTSDVLRKLQGEFIKTFTLFSYTFLFSSFLYQLLFTFSFYFNQFIFNAHLNLFATVTKNFPNRSQKCSAKASPQSECKHNAFQLPKLARGFCCPPPRHFIRRSICQHLICHLKQLRFFFFKLSFK